MAAVSGQHELGAPAPPRCRQMAQPVTGRPLTWTRLHPLVHLSRRLRLRDAQIPVSSLGFSELLTPPLSCATGVSSPAWLKWNPLSHTDPLSEGWSSYTPGPILSFPSPQ